MNYVDMTLITFKSRLKKVLDFKFYRANLFVFSKLKQDESI